MKRLTAFAPLFMLLVCFACNSDSSSNNTATEDTATQEIIKETAKIDSLSTELEEETQKLDRAMEELSKEFQ